jgi:hypothetical protein
MSKSAQGQQDSRTVHTGTRSTDLSCFRKTMPSHIAPKDLCLLASQADSAPLRTREVSPRVRVGAFFSLTVELIPVSESGLLAGLPVIVSLHCISWTAKERRTRYWLYNDKNRPFALEHALRLRAARANSRQRKLAMPAERMSSSSSSSAISSGDTSESTALASGACGCGGGKDAGGREAPKGPARAGVEDTNERS